MRTFSRIALLACVATSACLANAQTRKSFEFTTVAPKQMREVFASKVAPISADGRIGKWSVPVTQTQQTNTPNMVMAWDSMSTSPTTLNAYTQGVYGTYPGPIRLYNNSYRNYQWLNDIQVSPGTERKIGRFLRLAVYVNPGGGPTATGTANLYVKATTRTSFDDTGDGPALFESLGGVAGQFTNLAAGVYQLTIDLRSGSNSLPMPDSTGAIFVQIGEIGSGNTFVPLTYPYAVQPILGNMMSVGEPVKPGTNPSKSTSLQWDDDSDVAFGFGKPDYIFQDFTNTATTSSPFAELYDYSDAVLGNLQAAAAMFVDTNVSTISGTLSFSALSTTVPKRRAATFIITNASTNAVISTQTVMISSTGAYTIMDPNQGTGGNYKIYAQCSHFLAKMFTANTTGGVSVTGRNATLQNGDINRDNVVDSSDYFLLSDNYETAEGSPTWNLVDENGNFGRDADLNEDGVIDASDYFILSDSYDAMGDTP